MQRVSELVKQRLGIFERQQDGLAVRGTRKIQDIDDERTDIAAQLLLLAQARHPGTAVLGAAREIIAEEQSAMLAGGVAHLPDPHVLVPDWDAVSAFEGEPEQAVRRVEGGLDDALELKVWLDRGLLDVAADLAQLFRVIAPVPGRQGEVVSFLLHQRLQRVAIGKRMAMRGGPHAIEQCAHRLRRLGHGVVEPVMSKRGIAEQTRALDAQSQHLGDDRLVVGCAAAIAPRHPGLESFLAQVAPS